MENRKIKLLCIDDNLDNLISLKALIIEAFPESIVYTADGGKKGLIIAENEFPDVILLDVIMSDMDGFEVCKKLKSHDILKEIPVVFITAIKYDKENRIRALEVGAEAFLAKPIEENELAAQIRAMIKIKEANIEKIGREVRLEILVNDKVRELKGANLSTLNLLEDLKEEIENRKLAEAKIKQSEERYRKLIENAPAIVYSFSNKKGGYFYSSRVKEILGYSTEYLIEHPKLWNESIHPDDRYKIDEIINRNKDIRYYDLEYRIKDINGNWLWFQDRSIEIKINEDELTIEGIAIDITERKVAENIIREKDIEFRKLSDNLPDLLFQFTRRTDGTYYVPIATAGIKNIFGCTPEDVANDFTPIGKVIHPEDLERVISDIEYSAKNLTYFNCEFRVQIPGKDVQWIYSKSTPEKLPDGNITWYGFNTDITERKIMEVALKESEVRFRLMFEKHSAVMLLIDPESGKIVDSNVAASAFYGYDKSKLSLMHISEINTLSNKDIISYIKAAETQNQNYFIFPHRLSNGEIRTVEVYSSSVKFKSKTLLFSIIHDITERKKAEAEILKNKTHLQTILQSTGDGILAVGSNNDVLYYNKRFQELWSIPEEIIATKNDSILLKYVLDQLENPKEFITKVEELIHTNTESFDSVNFKDGKIYERYSCPLMINEKISGRVWSFRNVTEAKISEKIIRESEEKYRLVLNTMSEGLISVDNNEVIQYINERIVQMTGFSRDELIGKVAYEILVAKDYRELVKAKKDLRLKKKSDAYEVQFVKKNGEQFWVQISGSPIIDDDGNVIGSIGVHTDITHRKKDEDRILKLSQAVEQSPVSIIITNLNGDIEYVNQTLLNITGYTFEEVIGENPRILKSGITPIEVYKTMWETICAGNKWSGELQNKKKDGTLYWESVLITPIKNEEGHNINYLAINTDITHQKNAAMALEESSKRYQLLFEKASEGILFLSAEGIILGMNEAFAKMHGYTIDELLNLNIKAIDTPKYSKKMPDLLSRVLNGESVRFETEHFHKNGNIVSLAVSSSLIQFANESYIQAFHTDITEQKKTENLREKITDDLIRRNKDLEQFTYIVSHNLRAPVANIKGSSTILQSVELEESDKMEMINGLHHSVLKMENVIIDLNQILKIRNNINEKYENINFSELVNEIKMSLTDQISFEKFEIKCDFKECDTFYSLRSYIYSIFHNLISNSIKYKRDIEKSDIKIKTHKFFDRLSISFKDNGLGIDLEKKGDQVFGLYKRFHQDIDGKGMGLYMVKTQVETLGGTIKINSKVNEGTEFIIEFIYN